MQASFARFSAWVKDLLFDDFVFPALPYAVAVLLLPFVVPTVVGLIVLGNFIVCLSVTAAVVGLTYGYFAYGVTFSRFQMAFDHYSGIIGPWAKFFFTK